MLIKMLKTTPGSPNGIIVNTYEEGKEYDVPEGLGKVFIGMKVAVIYENIDIVKKPEKKPDETKPMKPPKIQANIEAPKKKIKKKNDNRS